MLIRCVVVVPIVEMYNMKFFVKHIFILYKIILINVSVYFNVEIFYICIETLSFHYLTSIDIGFD
jgi:hypothetical protein